MNPISEIVSKLCLRFADRRGRLTPLVGYALTWDTPSTDAHARGYTLIYRAGAFAKSLASGADITAVHRHDEIALVASTGCGSLLIAEDEIGLLAVMVPADTLSNRRLVDDIRSKRMGMSLRCGHTDGAVVTTAAGRKVLIITTATLEHVSITDRPASPATHIQLASDGVTDEMERIRLQAEALEWATLEQQQAELSVDGFVGAGASMINQISNARARIALALL